MGSQRKNDKLGVTWDHSEDLVGTFAAEFCNRSNNEILTPRYSELQ